MPPHRFAIADALQKFEEHHQTTERSHRPLRFTQFHFLPAPKSGNFPVHCFVLLGVSLNQLKHYRVRVEQCNLISGFRLSRARSRTCGRDSSTTPASRFAREPELAGRQNGNQACMPSQFPSDAVVVGLCFGRFGVNLRSTNSCRRLTAAFAPIPMRVFSTTSSPSLCSAG